MIKIPDWYEIRWMDAVDGLKYGVLDTTSDAAKVAAKTGHLLVEDAVFPERYMLPPEHVEPVPRIKGTYETDLTRFVEAAMKKAFELHDSMPVDVCAVGKLVRRPRGDGYAWYVVTKVTRGTCSIEWRGFSLDRWVDDIFGHGGQFPRRIIEPLIRGKMGAWR